MRTTSAFAVLLAAMLAPAAAGADGKPGKPAAAEKRTCRAEMPTGSHMERRVCHTAAEWAQIDAADQSGVDQLRNRSGVQTAPDRATRL